MKQKEILEQLPSNWSELKLKDYLKLTNIVVKTEDDGEAGIYNTFKTLSALTGLDESIFEAMPLNEIMPLANKLSFLQTMPEPKKNGIIKWKAIDEVKYNDFVNFITLCKDPFNNMAAIIKDFSVSKLSNEEILDLGMDEVHTGFFLLMKQSKKSLSNTMKTLVIRLIKNKTKATFLKLLHFGKNRKKLKE